MTHKICMSMQHIQQPISTMRAIKGVSMIEVLIALVVFSVGLLGLAGLQMNGLRLSHDSFLRGTASQLAADMADRIRANVQAHELGVAGPYHNPGASETANPGCIGLDSNGDPQNSSCTFTQLAQHDFYEWYSLVNGRSATAWHPAVAAQLPNATAVVCIDSTPDDGTPADPQCDGLLTVAGKNIYTIKIWWTERKDLQNPGTVHRYEMSFAP